VKRYNAEIHSQSAIEGILELRSQYGFQASDIEEVDVEIFDVAFDIIGGGEEGDKTIVESKESADHSLPYLIAVAILDGEVMPEQYLLERIRRSDVHALLRKVRVTPAADLSQRFPREMPCRLTVHLTGGHRLRAEKRDYEGFTTRPPNWESAQKKFDRLSEPHATPALRNRIVEKIESMEKVPVRSLMALLRQAETPALQEEALQYGGT